MAPVLKEFERFAVTAALEEVPEFGIDPGG
jgi:hypothetical protein